MGREGSSATTGRKLVGNGAGVVAVVLVWAALSESVEMFGVDVPAWLVAFAMYLLGAATVWGLTSRPTR